MEHVRCRVVHVSEVSKSVDGRTIKTRIAKIDVGEKAGLIEGMRLTTLGRDKRPSEFTIKQVDAETSLAEYREGGHIVQVGTELTTDWTERCSSPKQFASMLPR
ncbi:MAG: hypothetical protein ABL921_19730 [Pirellula sp.]